MKAKDLAALAALGVAGYAAYDKFGKKGEAKKDNYDREGDNRYSSPVIEKMDETDYDAPRTAPRTIPEDYDAPRTAPRTVPEDYDAPRTAPRDIGRMRPEDVGQGGSQVDKSNAFKKVKDKSSGAAAATAAPATATAAPAAPAVVKDYKQPFAKYPDAPAYTEATPAQKIAAIDAASGASHPSTKKTEALAAYSRAEAAKDLEKKKANGTFVPIPQNVKPAATVKPAITTPTAVTPSAPVSAAAAARQQAIDEKNYNSDLMKNRRQSVIDTLQNIPSGIANIFKPPEQVFQNKTYVKDGKVVRYNKGGVVKKMASGGLASSKMSKPSGASRGDGIAQRGRTRGTLR